jgi:hypothetical protein
MDKRGQRVQVRPLTAPLCTVPCSLWYACLTRKIPRLQYRALLRAAPNLPPDPLFTTLWPHDCLSLQVDAPPVSDGDFLTAWHMLVLPVVAEFRPDLILVSAGFDAVDKDPLGELTAARPAASTHPCCQHTRLLTHTALLPAQACCCQPLACCQHKPAASTRLLSTQAHCQQTPVASTQACSAVALEVWLQAQPSTQ